MSEKIYLCIDLKTFYASVECVDRGLNPFKTNLVVADASKGPGAICLAISPALKALGIRNRCRLFEIPNNVSYIAAMPRMKRYIEYSANIYAIYLKFISKEDIFAYSIDEMFMDVTDYLQMYQMTAEELATTMIERVYRETGITATAGIGTNLFLTKVALDITAKKSRNNIGYLDEALFKKLHWYHRPLTDFWQIGTGISKRLERLGITDMHGIATCNPDVLYREFGVNALYLIDHANGVEPTTIAQIKKYKPQNKSISVGQLFGEGYDYEKARVVVKEMVDGLSLDLIDKGLVVDVIQISIGYTDRQYKSTGASCKMTQRTNVYSILVEAFLELYDQTTRRNVAIKRLGLSLSGIVDEAFEVLDLFTDPKKLQKERNLAVTINDLKSRYGKNAVLRGMDYEDGATARQRNKLIGGHASGEE